MTGEQGRSHYTLTFAILALGGIAFALLQSLVAPALTTIQHDLHASPTAGAWILTAYLLSASVATPIVGRLGDMFGKKRMLVVALSLLGAGTLIAALATSISVMILGRVVQGGGGAVFPLAFAIIRDEFPRERVATGIALISALLGVGGGLGIVLAGPITEHLSYHWLFWLPLGVIVLAIIGAAAIIPESPVKTAGRVNWVGAGLLSAWLICLLLGVSEGPSWGWSSGRVLGLFAAAAVLVAAWVRAENRAVHPLVDMRMMRLRGVWTTNMTALLLGFGMLSSFILVPQFVELPERTGFGFGASVTQAGLFLVPATIGMLLVSPIAGRLSTVVGSRVPLIAGAAFSAISFVVLAAAHSQRWEIYFATSLLGIGIGFAFSAMANLIVEAVPSEQTGVATGMNTIMRTIGGSLGSGISASIIAGSVAANGLSSERGFTVAFAIAAGAITVGLVAALAVPARRRPIIGLEPAPAESDA